MNNKLADDAIRVTGRRFSKAVANIRQKLLFDAIGRIEEWQKNHLESYDQDGEPMENEQFFTDIALVISAAKRVAS